MEFPNKKMQSHQRVLGIPVLTFVIIVIAFCGITYYASSYASENSMILKKYEATRSELISCQRTNEKFDRKFKICTSDLDANEKSNRELTIKIENLESLKKAQENKNNECQSQVSSLHQFYLKIREYAGLMKDDDQMNTEDVSQAEIEEVIQAIKDKQANDLKDEKEKCEKMFQTKLESVEYNSTKKTHELEQLHAMNNELKEAVANARKLLEEKDNELSQHLREKDLRGFQQKPKKQENENIKMIDLNKKDEDDAAKNTEQSKKEVSDFKETTKLTTMSTMNTTVQLKQTELIQKEEVTELGNATTLDKVTTQPKPSSAEITKNYEEEETEAKNEEGETEKTETDEDADFDDHFDNDTN